MMSEFRCEFCDSDCNSASEMLACEERCAREDANTRGYFGRHNPNHRD